MKIIQLTKGASAIVDDCDYDALMKMSPWYTSDKGRKRYAHNDTRGAMHHVVVKRVTGIEPKLVDHRDGNGLNNTRRNLRIATHRQNQLNRGPNKQNSSGFKGISYCKQTGRWKAIIRVYGQFIFLGRFPTKTTAALEYNKAARFHFDDFAWLNRIEQRRKANRTVTHEHRCNTERRQTT